MKKAIIMSCSLDEILRILNEMQTKLLCKFAPQIVVPFKIYLYTKKELRPKLNDDCLNGKIVVCVTCERITNIEPTTDNGYLINNDVLSDLRLTKEELNNYGKGKWLSLMHITNVVKFDKAKDLKDFKKNCDMLNNKKYTKKHFSIVCSNCIALKNSKSDYLGMCDRRITTAPQTYLYVEEL